MALCPTVHDKDNYKIYKAAQKEGRTDWSKDAAQAFEREHQEKTARAAAAQEAAQAAAAAAKSTPGAKGSK